MLIKNNKLIMKETKYAIFNYQEDDNCLFEELSLYLEAEAKRIFKFFNVKLPAKKLIIKIIPTKKQFNEEFKTRHKYDKEFRVPKYVRGEFCQFDNTIYYLSINDYKNTTHSFRSNNYELAVKDYKKTLVHEFVHYANYLFNLQNDNDWTSKYLREGIAVYLSKQKENMDIGFNFTLEELLETDMKRSCYDGYYLITKYLIENYDRDFILNLFTSSNQARKFLEKELFYKAKDYYSTLLKG